MKDNDPDTLNECQRSRARAKIGDLATGCCRGNCCGVTCFLWMGVIVERTTYVDTRDHQNVTYYILLDGQISYTTQTFLHIIARASDAVG